MPGSWLSRLPLTKNWKIAGTFSQEHCSVFVDAAGNPNPLAQTNDTKDNKVTPGPNIGSGTANISDETRWSPKGVLSLLDALEAIEWAMILVRMGTEAEVRAFISWWRCLVRTKTQKLEHIKAYWLEANWKLCLELRRGS